MCHNCDYRQLLDLSGIGSTPNRLKVLEIVGSNTSPLSAREIYDTISRSESINRVTVYRILDLLVESNVIERISSGGRSFHYGLAPNENHRPHPHFYCRHCGNMECLSPESLRMDLLPLERTFPGEIMNVEVRIDGICKTCLKLSNRAVN
jgi:Fur family transcriptional regulator, ferric uptake regulator